MKVESKRLTKPSERKMTQMNLAEDGESSISSRRGANTRILSPMLWRTQWLILSVVAMVCLPAGIGAQSLDISSDPSTPAVVPDAPRVQLPYQRPTQKVIFTNYTFDAFGPYPIVGAMFAAGINQLGNSPPEWHQGMEGYGKRFGSDFAIAAVGTTTRFGLAEAFKEDTLYYRCECSGVFPRLRHAAISTLTSRRGLDGHRVFSMPALVAPYAGSMSAVYGWYPDRYSAKDGFRIGNYSLLATMGGNIALEFLHSGRHSFLSRMHLNNRHGSPAEGTKE